jgi:hypothetical protein
VTTLPERYREVSVTDVDVPLEAGPLRDLLTSRPVYRRTRYVVVRRGGQAALVEVVKTTTTPLFCPVEDAVLLAGPEETTYLHRLVLDPAPVRLRVLDVAPPWPAKLLDQVVRVLDTAEDLPGILPLPQVVSLEELLPDQPAGHYLLPCRGGDMDVPGAQVSYLDEVPPKADWTLLGCARSRAIHDFFYDGPVPQIDTCPRALAKDVELGPGEVLLTKCCLLEEHIETEGRTVVVPWGASFAHLREALNTAVELADP